MASLVRAMVNGTAVVNATKVQELLNDVDAAMDWKNDPLRYLWATASAVSTFISPSYMKSRGLLSRISSASRSRLPDP